MCVPTPAGMSRSCGSPRENLPKALRLPAVSSAAAGTRLAPKGDKKARQKPPIAGMRMRRGLALAGLAARQPG